MQPSPELIQKFGWMLNLFEDDGGKKETNYRATYIYRDGNGGRKQITLGRGFSQDGGNLWKVLQRYIDKRGVEADFFTPYKARMKNGDLWQDREFLKRLGLCADERAMMESQDEIFLEAYIGPAIKWAAGNKFELPLSYGVAVDSYLHSGQMTPFLMRSFPDKMPVRGGDEKKWMIAYLKARLAWFTRVSGPLHTCQFRPKFFLAQIKAANWELACPLVIPEKGRIC